MHSHSCAMLALRSSRGMTILPAVNRGSAPGMRGELRTLASIWEFWMSTNTFRSASTQRADEQTCKMT